MKGCLKSSPLITPTSSTLGTPSGSGSASPGSANIRLPCLSKRVSFCQKEGGLEEFFEADDWDRTPAPVAPKLSYQDLLELKQIMQSLPRAKYSNFCRMPFSTTSMPGSSAPPASSTAPPFPISRLAATPSLVPSKWKNREDSANVDPEILPYLDSVPIRLLPLLPTASTDANENSTSSYPEHAPSLPEPPVTSRSHSGSTPTPLPSPAIQPPTSSQNSTPTKRKPNFSFVPLLPVHEEAKVTQESAMPLLVHSAPQVKHFNMPFVPLLPPEEHSTTPTSAPAASEPANDSTPQSESPPDDEHQREQAEFEEREPSSYFPITYHRHRHSPTSTPSLSSASDTDTESEAPSMNSPDPSSPVDDYDALSHYFMSRAAFSHPDVEHPHDTHVAHAAHNPYFPHYNSIAPDAGLRNPPISAQHTTALSHMPAVKNIKLAALPSPALAPPSPFSLYPPGAEDADADGEGEVDLGEAVLRVPVPAAGAKRMFAARPSGLSVSSTTSSSSSASSFSSRASVTGEGEPEQEPEQEVDLERLRQVEPSPAPPSGATSLSTTPELTIEYMREAYDDMVAAAAKRQEEEAARESSRSLLGPSISRIERRKQ